MNDMECGNLNLHFFGRFTGFFLWRQYVRLLMRITIIVCQFILGENRGSWYLSAASFGLDLYKQVGDFGNGSEKF